MLFLYFFFQAEDGIRDWSVTGVQTCALPILNLPAGYVPAPNPNALWGCAGSLGQPSGMAHRWFGSVLTGTYKSLSLNPHSSVFHIDPYAPGKVESTRTGSNTR